MPLVKIRKKFYSTQLFKPIEFSSGIKLFFVNFIANKIIVLVWRKLIFSDQATQKGSILLEP